MLRRRAGRARRVATPPLVRTPPRAIAARGAGPAVVTGTGRPRARPGRRPLAVAPRGRGRLRAPVADQWFTGVGADADPRLGARAGQPRRRARRSRTSPPLARPARRRRPRCAGCRCPATAACGSTSARSSRSRGELALHVVHLARAGSRRTCSTPSTSWAPGAAARTGCPRRPRPAPTTCCSACAGRRVTHARARQPGRRRGAGRSSRSSPTRSVVRAGRRGAGPGARRQHRPGPRGRAVRKAAARRRHRPAGRRAVRSPPPLRTFVDGDLSAGVRPDASREPTATVLPGGRAELLLSGARRAGRADVTGWSATGAGCWAPGSR